jgi:hypothetical protein
MAWPNSWEDSACYIQTQQRRLGSVEGVRLPTIITGVSTFHPVTSHCPCMAAFPGPAAFGFPREESLRASPDSCLRCHKLPCGHIRMINGHIKHLFHTDAVDLLCHCEEPSITFSTLNQGRNSSDQTGSAVLLSLLE